MSTATPDQGTGIPRSTAESERFWRRLERPASSTRRRFPRVHADVPVTITVDGEPIGLRSNDVSQFGLQVRCDVTTAKNVSQVSDPMDRPCHAIELALSFSGKVHEARARARVMHVTPVPGEPEDSAVAVGFELLDFEDGSCAVLEDFIAQHLQPA